MRWVCALLLALAPISASAQTAVGNGGAYYVPTIYASTGAGSNTSGASSSYNPQTCNTGAVNCSSGTLSVSVPVSPGITHKWLITIIETGSVAELTTTKLNLCIASGTGATNGTTEGTLSEGGSLCNNGLSNRIAGSGSFGDSNLVGPNLAGMARVAFSSGGGFNITATCNASSSGTAATYYGTCTMTAVPY